MTAFDASLGDRIGDAVAGMDDLLIGETISICRIPSPTFGEAERGAYIARRLGEVGAVSIETDEIGNVTGVIPGAGSGPTLMVVAHIDTVFPEGTDVEPRWDGRHWRAPGIRDNSASAAVTLLIPEVLRRAGLALEGDLVLGFSVGEEGLGNLRGMRALMERFGPRVSAVIAADGNIGAIGHEGICIRRLKIAARAQGGHSWADAGKASALHALVEVAAGITAMNVPAEPRSAVNIGTFKGGTSVNTIAERAELLLDLRSIEQETLARLEEDVRALVGVADRAEGIEMRIEVVGDRPGGRIARDHPLVEAMLRAYEAVDIRGKPQAISTDANIPLWLGIPASSMGVSAGGGIHTLDEFLDPLSLAPGARALVSTLVSLQRSLRRDHPAAPLPGL